MMKVMVFLSLGPLDCSRLGSALDPVPGVQQAWGCRWEWGLKEAGDLSGKDTGGATTVSQTLSLCSAVFSKDMG